MHAHLLLGILTFASWHPNNVEDQRVVDLMGRISRISRWIRKQVVQ